MVKDPIDLIEKIIENIDIFVFHYESSGNIELIIIYNFQEINL